MAKLLRLDVAQLTDVGRKREHNEDNMAYVIPKDPQVMMRKGALFIVADGMGGHAAGEVASEIAVDTVSNAYYQDENDDVPTSLLQAIRRANAAIHQRAAENMLRSGMGTTCVSAVLRGNVAYIANVGDSRAYFIRKSRIYQISQDHSWVAEQVRAGLLTEEQARTHAQRNVITRSLGTQPDVDVDIFREILEEGDTLILCSDGLSGLVNDEELLRTVDQFVPQESVYHLVERANENGGPDNITAIVARVQEVGVEPVSIRQPVPVGGPELSNEDTARLFAPPGPGFNLPSRNGDLPAPGGSFSYSSPPRVSPDSDTIPQPAVQAKKRRGRLFYPSLIMLVLFILVAGVGSGYYFLRTNQSQNITQTLNQATTLVNHANQAIASHNSIQALNDLSSAQQALRDLKQKYTLNSDDATQLNNLQSQLVSATRSAIAQYNQSGLITLLPCTSSAPTNELNTAATSGLVVITVNGATTHYTLNTDGKVYQLVQKTSSNNANQYELSNPSAPANAQVISIAGGKGQILALSKQTNNGTNSYSINLLDPGQHGALQTGKSEPIDATHLANGQTPTLISAWNESTGTVIYVALTSSSTPDNVTILAYTLDSKGVFVGPVSSTISVSQGIVGMTATANQLFLLQAAGSIESSSISASHKISSVAPVLVDQQIATPLSASNQNFTANMNVPTATPSAQKESVPLQVPPSSTSPAILSTALVLEADGNTTQYHLFIGDPVNHRVLDLTPLATAGGPSTQTPTTTPNSTTQGNSPTLTLVQQYVAPNSFALIKGLTADSSSAISVLGQHASSNEDLMVINIGAQKSCAP